MIVTLTPNPSIDRTITVTELRRGEVHRATSSRIDPGGKGINVSRALSAQGCETLAVLPVGGPEGHLLIKLLADAGVPHRSVAVAGAARMNIAVVEPDGTTTKLNEAGPTLSAAEIAALLDAVADAARRAQWVVGCGSLPPGAPPQLYAVLVRQAKEHGVKVAIDSSGEPFTHAVAARPHLIKPNREELAELVGRRLETLGDVLEAAEALVSDGIETVVVSLGGDGALVVDRSGMAHAAATITRPLSTVGAGDCLLAGLLSALTAGADSVTALGTGVSWGAAAVTLPGSRVPTPADLAGIPVTIDRAPDLTRRLSD